VKKRSALETNQYKKKAGKLPKKTGKRETKTRSNDWECWFGKKGMRNKKKLTKKKGIAGGVGEQRNWPSKKKGTQDALGRRIRKKLEGKRTRENTVKGGVGPVKTGRKAENGGPKKKKKMCAACRNGGSRGSGK